jgi:hypothetical protein
MNIMISIYVRFLSNSFVLFVSRYYEVLFCPHHHTVSLLLFGVFRQSDNLVKNSLIERDFQIKLVKSSCQMSEATLSK